MILCGHFELNEEKKIGMFFHQFSLLLFRLSRIFVTQSLLDFENYNRISLYMEYVVWDTHKRIENTKRMNCGWKLSCVSLLFFIAVRICLHYRLFWPENFLYVSTNVSRTNLRKRQDMCVYVYVSILFSRLQPFERWQRWSSGSFSISLRI